MLTSTTEIALVEAEHGHVVLAQIAVPPIIPARAHNRRLLAHARVRVTPTGKLWRRPSRSRPTPDRAPWMALGFVPCVHLPLLDLALDALRLALEQRSVWIRRPCAAVAMAVALVALAGAARPQIPSVVRVALPALFDIAAIAHPATSALARAKMCVATAMVAAAARAPTPPLHERSAGYLHADVPRKPRADARLPNGRALVGMQRSRVEL